MSYAAIIKEIGRGAKGSRSLERETARTLFADILDSRIPDLELGAILLCLRIKSETTDELLGFKDAMDAAQQSIIVGAGPRCVVLPTYNGARRQANLMPLLAFLLKARGIPVLIQGRHDFETRVSPFTLLKALGVSAAATTADASAQLAHEGLACIELAQLLPGLDRLLALRPRLGVRGSGHTVAKLLDPCPERSVRVVAVTHPEYLERMHDFIGASQATAMLMRGTEGEAYANPRRQPRLAGYLGGSLHGCVEGEEGGAPPREDLPDVPDAVANANLIRDMLAGKVSIPEPIQRQADLLEQLARS